MKINQIGLIILPILFISCNINNQPTTPKIKEKKIVVKKRIFKHQYPGSLYTQQGTSLFADKKDLQIGDILQIKITETLKNLSKNSIKNLKNNELKSSGASSSLFSSGKKNGNIKIKSSNKINNSLIEKSDEKFVTVISVVINEIYKNGNYFIVGSKELYINNQKQRIIISGIIRPYDIESDNTVLSSQVANLKVRYEKDEYISEDNSNSLF